MEATQHNDYLDMSTGFYNNLYFKKTLDSYLTEFNETDEKLGLFYIDIVGIGETPIDTLKEIGNTLINTARDYDVVARVGISKFAVITPHIKTEDLSVISNRFHLKLVETVNNSSNYRFPIGGISNEHPQNSSEELHTAANGNLKINRRLILES